MLENQAIDFIELEAGMNHTSCLHVPFNDLKSYLKSHNCYLFGIYKQKQEWIKRKQY